MAKIKAAHLRQFINERSNEKITFSRMVEKLNEVANDNAVCKSCGREFDTLAIRSTQLCTACFTGNA